MKNVVFPPSCINLPLHTKVVTKVVVATSTPSQRSNLLGYDYHILQGSVLNMLVTKRRREWNRIGVVTKPLCMVLH